jgi:hypothetical protein
VTVDVLKHYCDSDGVFAAAGHIATILPKYYWSDKMRENEMGVACVTCGET